MSLDSLRYVGRFAPSPSGPLHFGSLLAALASYLDAKSQSGQWLVRMEDLDTPRCIPGADTKILATLEDFGLEWDGDVLYQSSRHDTYQSLLNQLQTRQQSYFCQCTRKIIKASGGVYLGTCRDKQLDAAGNAMRFRLPEQAPALNDRIFGKVDFDYRQIWQDPIVKRRDHIFAYNLAVVVDDIEQNITHVVRGSDLLTTTPIHLALYDSLAATAPTYAHIPVIGTKPGFKLSKQNHAPAIDASNVSELLFDALVLLQQQPDPKLVKEDKHTILQWGIENWQITRLPRKLEMIVDTQDKHYYSDPE